MAGRIPYLKILFLRRTLKLTSTKQLCTCLQEKLILQEDLSIGNGDDIGGDVGGHITGLGLDDGKRGERAGAEIVRDLGCALQQTGVKVENITGVGLS